MKSIKKYLSKLEKYPQYRFIFELTIIAIIIRIISGLIYQGILSLFDIKLLSQEESYSYLFKAPPLVLFIFIVIVTPLVETFLFQLLLIKFIKVITKNIAVIIVIASLVFSLTHNEGMYVGAFFVGLILNWSFIIKSKKSMIRGFFTVTLIHTLHNLLSFIFLILTK